LVYHFGAGAKAMDQETVNRAMEQAQALVDAVSDPRTKAAAFAVLFSRFLDAGSSPARVRRREPVSARGRRSEGATSSGRILGLKEDGFFTEQRALSEVRDQLGARGWHYPLTALSGVMQALVQARELRRAQAKSGKRQVWKYSNY
jgi:hypothetical protein